MPCRSLVLFPILLAFASGANVASAQCPPVPFQAARSAKLGLSSQVLQSVLVNDDRGKLKLGARTFMPTGTNLTAHHVIIGPEASAGSVNANLIRFHPTAQVEGPIVGPLAVPVTTPFCTVPPGTCGTESVVVSADDGLAVLEPGSYADIRVGRAGFVRLQPGTYDLCNLSVARTGALVNEGPVTINVLGRVRIAADALVVPATGQPRITLNSSGTQVVVGLGSVMRADIVAPSAKFKIGRQASFDGTFCVRDARIGSEAAANCTVPE